MSLRDWSDRTLVRHAQSSKDVTRVFGVLYERHLEWSRTRACRYVNEADAWDLAEEAFLYLWKKIPDLRDPYRIRGILGRSLYHRAVDLVRKTAHAEAWDPFAFDRVRSDPWASGANSALSRIEESELWTAIESGLHAREFRILVMRVCEGRGFSEIANRENLTEVSVRRSLHEARGKLKKSEIFPNKSFP